MTQQQKTTMKIWTKGYRPFIFGGDINAYVSIETEVDGPHDIGQGYQAFIAMSPNGKTAIVEATTGAIVGWDLEQVREDVASGDKTLMAEQVQWARNQAKDTEQISPIEFWKMLKAL